MAGGEGVVTGSGKTPLSDEVLDFVRKLTQKTTSKSKLSATNNTKYNI